jgi:hypothetical protein
MLEMPPLPILSQPPTLVSMGMHSARTRYRTPFSLFPFPLETYRQRSRPRQY